MKFKENSAVKAIVTAKGLFLFLAILFVLFNFVAIPNSTGQLGLWKIMLGVSAAIAGYITSKILHPTMSITKLLAEDKVNETPDAIKLLGVLIYRAAIMSSFVLGILLGV
jgi:hypothetical protein